MLLSTYNYTWISTGFSIRVIDLSRYVYRFADLAESMYTFGIREPDLHPTARSLTYSRLIYSSEA
jgi:hypothetical protein